MEVAHSWATSVSKAGSGAGELSKVEVFPAVFYNSNRVHIFYPKTCWYSSIVETMSY